ncbi:MAG: SpoVR family protein [Chloroflexi bacterium]|nr:SpoVR family protein [Chloroflexota bacterium]MCL5110529.1 SpoVR family protein [Chloroflexota bacterium]
MDREVTELEQAIGRAWDVARGFGLDPFDLRFELVPANIMYEFGAYGLPTRFSHWTYGRTYQEMKTMYDYGLNKIYELVINTDPCYAFLLDSNSVLQNKLVVAHVIGHSDFFKNNVYFQETPRDMLESAAVNADRIRAYEYRHGKLAVEQFLDAVLALQEHVDPNQIIRRQQERQRGLKVVSRPRQRQGPYDDLLSVGLLEEQHEAPPAQQAKFPVEPEKDLLLFLMENSTALSDWQRDVVAIVRAEMLYFTPQMRTKIMNEGWASFWHSRIMRELELTDGEAFEFARLHAGVLSPSGQQLNPYYVGFKLFEDLERRWDHPTTAERARYGRQPGQGRAKIFEVRETESDVSFLRNYLTEELVRELDLHVYKQEGEETRQDEENWEEVRDFLVNSMSNFGHPYLLVTDGNFEGRGELLIEHVFEGQELDQKYAERTLPYLYRLWGQPVHVQTVIDEKPHMLTYANADEGMTKRRL